MLIGLANPAQPRGLGYVELAPYSCFGWVADVLVKDDQALLGGRDCVVILNLGTQDTPRPTYAGAIASIAGHLQLDENGILYGSAARSFGVADPLGGLRTAVLGNVLIKKVDPPTFRVDLTGKTVEPVTVTYRLIGPPPDFQGGSIQLKRNDAVLGVYPAPGLTDGAYDITVPPGVAMNPPPTAFLEIRVVNPDGSVGEPAYKEIVE
jgi:hypothetical protein